MMADRADSIKPHNDNQIEKELKDVNIEQVFIKSEKVWDDNDVETNYNILKHEIYETVDPSSTKDNYKICQDHGKNENGLELICIKKEITEELIIKDEPDFIQPETRKNAESEKFSNSHLYFSTKDQSITGSNKNNLKSVKDEHIKDDDILRNKQLNTDNDVTHKNNFHCDKSHTCDVCKKIFIRKGDLNRHKIIHTGEKPYACDVCQKTFTFKCTLKQHKRFHSGEKPYECDVCKKVFSIKSNLNQHKRIHNGDGSYACDVCNKTFYVKHNLLSHKLIHTGERPYACDICEKTFSLKGNLVKHKLIHTGERPFACDICKITFYLKGNLVQHKRLHTGEKPHACNICKRTFSFKGDLCKHINIHNGGKK